MLAPNFAPVSRLSFSDQQELQPLPATHYESELMLRLTWDAHDLLEGTLDREAFLQSLLVVEHAFAGVEENLHQLREWTETRAASHPDDPAPSQALYYGTRGAELFREGLEMTHDALDADDDVALVRGVNTVLDGNDHVSHCFVLMKGNSGG